MLQKLHQTSAAARFEAEKRSAARSLAGDAIAVAGGIGRGWWK
jgi:hypothetical protein